MTRKRRALPADFFQDQKPKRNAEQQQQISSLVNNDNAMDTDGSKSNTLPDNFFDDASLAGKQLQLEPPPKKKKPTSEQQTLPFSKPVSSQDEFATVAYTTIKKVDPSSNLSSSQLDKRNEEKLFSHYMKEKSLRDEVEETSEQIALLSKIDTIKQKKQELLKTRQPTKSHLVHPSNNMSDDEDDISDDDLIVDWKSKSSKLHKR